MKLLASLTPIDDGRFDFGAVPPGQYWMAVSREGKELAIAITVDLQKDWGRCEDQGALIEEKYLIWTKVGTPPIL
jgi:hypothetical protein